ncbi:MAG TPA: (Fe-S)-binding protein [Nocardioidaceae bacterium]|nr:(Fe-S)-binding protein [Nocardioidaceae bacterium]
MQVVAAVLTVAITLVALALFARAATEIVRTVMVGQPVVGRRDEPGQRCKNMLVETLGHTRMLQWSGVGAVHWVVFVGFGFLFFTLLTAYGQVFDPEFALPLIGHWVLFEWLSELLAWTMLVAIGALIAVRLANRPGRKGRSSRFYRSTMWQGYFVEAVIAVVGLCIVVLRALEYALGRAEGEDWATIAHFPLTAWIGSGLDGLSVDALEAWIVAVATVKVVVSMTWAIVLGLNATMGVAWHRFTVWPNIWFKREASGRTALGPLKPIVVDGEPLDFENLENLDEDAALGVGKVEDFTWKGLLDFSTCTECGRCQSQCPAWNTDKPLSPKLLITALRGHAYEKAPYLRAAEPEREHMLAAGGDTLAKELERPLIGDEAAYGVIDPDVLWSCTSCGACVQQCPVDIEHVDHIMDMRRYQVLVESNFPAELNQLFRGLETKGNPWNMAQNARMDWAKDLPFPVKQVGGAGADDPADLTEVEWLFWVGCAGAYEDRAKKTTRAVAELLHLAGVDFAVLGEGETCTGDPARRSGNEFVFQVLAMQNAEVLKEAGATKVVATCAHCFNTLKNEYEQLGVELEVVHHTQLLNRLVREGRLTPVADAGASVGGRTITYHDPCYLGRHNQVYAPPRELLDVLPGATFTEMPRNSERSFCCGAGGARMWMEEKIGTRINSARTAEAVATGADQIAVGCPFCRVMLSDGLTSQQAAGQARDEVEVLDVAQLLLAAVTREPAPGATAAEPGAGDRGADTVTRPSDVGALAGTTPDEAAAARADPAGADATGEPDPDHAAPDDDGRSDGSYRA